MLPLEHLVFDPKTFQLSLLVGPQANQTLINTLSVRRRHFIKISFPEFYRKFQARLNAFSNEVYDLKRVAELQATTNCFQ